MRFDSAWAVSLVRRHQRRFGIAPRQVSMDGGFASQANLTAIKRLTVTDVCFTKKRGLAVRDMTRRQWVYGKLRRFRAGIEAGISLLKRVFGLARCIWKGPTGFHAYVRMAVLAANVLLLARTLAYENFRRWIEVAPPLPARRGLAQPPYSHYIMAIATNRQP